MTARPGTWGRHLTLSAVLGLVALALYLLLGLPLGIPGQWVWRANNLPVSLLPAFLLALGYVAVAGVLSRREWKLVPTLRRALWLALLVLLIFGMQAALLNATGAPWISPGSVIISPVATTYFSTSYDIQHGARAWTAAYQDRMPALDYHVRTHPPGLVLLFYAIRQLAARGVPAYGTQFDAIAEAYRVFGLAPTPGDAAAAIISAFLLALLGALGIIPIYLLALRLMSDQAALYATLLAGTIPALLLFGASPDLLIFTLTATTLALSYAAWREGRALPAFFAGLVFAVASFLSLGVLAVAGWLGLLVIVGTLRRPDRPATVRMFVPLLLSVAVGFGVVYLVLSLGLGYHPIAVAREALFAHRGVTTVEQARSYWAWLGMNPVEFLVFAGLPLLAAVLWALPAVRRGEDLVCLRTFLIASVLGFALLDLSGTVRAEVGRIWLFLMWPLALAAAPAFDRPDRAGALRFVLLFQVLQAILMKAYLYQYIVL